MRDRVELLAGARHTAPPRHRSLEASVEWSYQLLGVQEQRLFADVSVFQGLRRRRRRRRQQWSGDRAPGRPRPVVVAGRTIAGGRRSCPGERPLLAARDASVLGRAALGSRRAPVGLSRAPRRGRAGPSCLRRRRSAGEWGGGGVRRARPFAARPARRPPPLARGGGPRRVAPPQRVAVLVRLQRHPLRGARLDHLERAPRRRRPPPAGPLGAAATAAWQRGDLAAARRLAERGIEAAHRLGNPPGCHRAFGALGEVRPSRGTPAAPAATSTRPGTEPK